MSFAWLDKGLLSPILAVEAIEGGRDGTLFGSGTLQ